MILCAAFSCCKILETAVLYIILHPLCVTVKYYHLPRVKIGWFLTNNSLMPNALCINELSSRKPTFFVLLVSQLLGAQLSLAERKTKTFERTKIQHK